MCARVYACVYKCTSTCVGRKDNNEGSSHMCCLTRKQQQSSKSAYTYTYIHIYTPLTTTTAALSSQALSSIAQQCVMQVTVIKKSSLYISICSLYTNTYVHICTHAHKSTYICKGAATWHLYMAVCVDLTVTLWHADTCGALLLCLLKVFIYTSVYYICMYGIQIVAAG